MSVGRVWTSDGIANGLLGSCARGAGAGGGWVEGVVKGVRSVRDWNRRIASGVVCRRGLGRGWTR